MLEALSTIFTNKRKKMIFALSQNIFHRLGHGLSGRALA
jgi:hypothetical protein